MQAHGRSRAEEETAPLPRRRVLPFWAAVGALACVWLHVYEQQLKSLDDVPEVAIDVLRRFNWTDELEYHFELKRRPSEDVDGVAKHPLVMVPGIISCGLELWQPGECFGDDFFRTRLWGGLGMGRAILSNFSCWLSHMTLDAATGLDQPGCEVRAAEGFAGCDYFAPGYWLWAKIFAEAASVGYDRNSMHVACYDWRLSYKNLERRDRYFTRLRQEILLLHATDDHKVVLVGHSMGASLSYYFLSWAELVDPGFADRHIHAYVSLGGSLLGAIAPLGNMLSGEMQATAELGPINDLIDTYGKELSREMRRDVGRKMGGLGSLLPKGGDAIWGGDVITLSNNETLGLDAIAPDLLAALGPHTGGYDLDARLPTPSRDADPLDAASANPLSTALPPAPDMTVYCLYGVGISTERKFTYTGAPGDAASEAARRDHSELGTIDRSGADGGVGTGDGDGTVPLESLGFPCAALWRGELAAHYNPAGSRVVLREHGDEPERFNPRGGPKTARHVEIIGNSEIITTILRIATGAAVREDRVVSDIRGMSARIARRLGQQLLCVIKYY